MTAVASPGARTTASFEVHGLRLAVTGDWPEVVEDLRLDFAWFESLAGNGPADVEVTIERRPPNFDAFGNLAATFVTPRNVVYQSGGRTVVDYFGSALSVLDRCAGRLVVQGEERALVRLAAYSFMVSRIGEHLDAIGLPRLHGLGLAGRQGGVVVMFPAGGGKSTLALRALRSSRTKLLSDDSPLLDRRGRVHPFPLRIGVNPTDADSLPEGQVRVVERLERHPKLALGVEAFADRIAREPVPLRHVVIGRRTLGRDARLSPAPRRAAAGPLVREGVVGVGLYQGMEFLLQRGARDVLSQAGTAATRALCCSSGLVRARVWRLDAGRDRERTWSALLSLLD
jgi:hypothetical protein